ncbi:signal transduction histidine-protein kinase BaeS [Clostridium tepidiprofundi DSM 19306]|uniref:histidine kinase n=1 Tax=Clostridium tepidiprofundi DSM 19306 TaxID=1121338 RepID=A0A151B653_9CLOT|nr:HAMP domain-containing sensor histidine kinase [Clostridium tepidiprofundi]KYH35408.1 signal transduction histidine-protein kinase BaeS [Clostridium tepidiprofundi DSM 19306]
MKMNKKIKLSTKMSLYFGFTAILLTIMFFVMTHIMIDFSFNEYRQENENAQVLKVVEYIENIYENNKNITPHDFENLRHMFTRGGYHISIYDENGNFLWENVNKKQQHMKGMSLKQRNHFVKKYPIEVNNTIKGYVSFERFGFPPLSQIDKKFKSNLFRGLLIIAVVGVIITILIGIMLSKQISKPILKIKNTADILRNGELSARVKIKTNTKEIEDLNKSINYLAESLEEQETLRKRLTADISHELRTPLNVLQNQLEAIIDGIFEASPKRLNICHEEVVRLTDLVKNIEKLTTLDKPEFELEKENVSLNKLIESVIEQFKPVFNEKNIHVNFSFRNEVTACIDKNKIKQVLINMLSNSNKFTNKNGYINISLSEKGTIAIVKIQDNGIGIDEYDLPHIFERFYRAENSRNRKTGGTGLGLSIVRGIIEAHKGNIYVTSKKNEGTTFTLEIPTSVS